MKICFNCKTENKDTANFCRQCGFVFSGVKLSGREVDEVLLEKINELQMRVSDAESKTNNAKREVNALNSKVSSLINRNSNIQNKLTQTERQLTSVNSALVTERQIVQTAQKKIENAKKEIETAKSNNGNHLLYIFIIVMVSIIGIVEYNGREEKTKEIYSLTNEKKVLSNNISSLESKNASLTNINKSLYSILQKIGSKTPLFIDNVYVRNSGESYGSTIYSSNTTYINPKVKIFSLIDGPIDIDVKYYTPYGLSTDVSSSGGYSFSDYFYVNKNQNTICEFDGWGNSSKGSWNPGNYRFEFYYKGKCIGSHSFRIY